jgi:hypothetical protein
MAVDFASAFSGGSAIADLNIGDVAWDVLADGAGNTFVTGKFAGTVDFDPGVGSYELTSNSPTTRDDFIAKYDASGSLLWVQAIAHDTYDGLARTLALDNAGNVFVAGSFAGSAIFGSDTLTSAGSTDVFVTKLDSDGDFVWTRQFGGTNADGGAGVAVDSSNNLVLIAQMRTHVSGNQDALIAKLDSSGNVQWTFQVGASTSAGRGNSTNWARGTNITVDDAGRVYATGSFYGSVDFDPGSGTATLQAKAPGSFVLKLTSSGNPTWARAFIGGSSDIANGADIAVDASGNVYTTGSFSNSIDFDPGTKSSQKFILSTGGGGLTDAAYVSALNSNGNFLWAKSTRFVDSASIHSAHGTAIALDGVGGVYLTGSFDGTTDFDPGPGTFNLTSAGGSDAFVWKLDTSGGFAWAGQMGGTGGDFGRGISVDSAGDMFVAGNFNGTADFDPGPGTYDLTSAGGYDFFVVKLTQSGALTIASAKSQATDLMLALESESIRRRRVAAIDLVLAALDAENARLTGWDAWLDQELPLSPSSPGLLPVP